MVRPHAPVLRDSPVPAWGEADTPGGDPSHVRCRDTPGDHIRGDGARHEGYKCGGDPLLVTWSAALAFVVALSAAGPPPTGSRVRAATAQVQVLVDEAVAMSPTIRDLLARLACSDVIVYVEVTPSPQVPRARTKLVSASPGVRFLRIGIHTSIAGNEWPALLAHELQHAVEIADRDEVRDDKAVRRLYMAIGRAGGADRFETDAALDVERQVRLECRQASGS